MPHEHRASKVERVAHVHHVLGVTGEGRVAGLAERGEVRAARAHVVEQHHPVVLGQGWDGEAPHVLVAAEPVRKNHRRALGIAGDGDVVPALDIHTEQSLRPKAPGSPHTPHPTHTTPRLHTSLTLTLP